MAKYRKKPVIIEAFQFTQTNFLCQKDCPKWIKDAVSLKTIFYKDGNFYCKTLEGDLKISLNDYIIQGVSGELYLCKPDIFKLTYEEVK